MVDQDDHETRKVIDEMPGFDFTSVLCDGTYPSKTNAGYAASADEELILPTADDVVFHDGWLQAVLPHFEAGWQVVGTYDCSPITEDGGHVTMPIVRRSYIEDPGAVYGEPGKVFCEGYHHSRVETELWHLALHRDVAIFEKASVIEHRHPSWGSRPVDDTDRKGQMRNREADDALFHARKAEWESEFHRGGVIPADGIVPSLLHRGEHLS